MKRFLVNSLFTIVLVFAGSVVFAQIDTNAREIPWTPIKDENILWTKRVWREIAVYERQNVALTDAPQTPQENVFANVLLSGIYAGAFHAYSDDLSFGKGEKKDDSEGHYIYGDRRVNKNIKPLVLKHALTKEEVNKRIAFDPANFSTMTRAFLNFYELHKNDSLLFPAEQAETKKMKRKRERKPKTEAEQAVLINDTTASRPAVTPSR